MEICYVTQMRRFCEGNSELLRVTVSYPQTGKSEVFDDFYKEIAERSITFAESRLFPVLLEQYHALSEHDRKFRAHKRIYSVACEAKTTEDIRGVRIDVTLSVSLRDKAGEAYCHCEKQRWSFSEDGVFMIPEERQRSRKS